eukprot:9692763-Heterocapsa_arctica.AAC.1
MDVGRRTASPVLQKDNTSGFKKGESEINSSTILVHWKEMKAYTQYKNWTIPQKVDKLCAFMAGLSALERKELSKLGAVRLSRKQAINFMHSCISTQYIYTLMTIA